ncbi:MAG: BREX-1 system phosphatase PglZ type A [Alphaproteobacteria bacterium]|nr:BREX-1 system phosphatase PglZ type A [Alphaproteobacteria bacterium]
MTSTEKVLTQKFETSRIVCWRDKKNELHDEFTALNLPGVEKIEVKNNEFTILYRVLREESEKKFLIFTTGVEPQPEENWLLDLELTYDRFYADQASLWLGELGLGYDCNELTENHSEFFVSPKRRAALKKLLALPEPRNAIRMKMLAVATEADCRIDAVLETLLAELAARDNEKYGDVQKYALDEFLWNEVSSHYGYRSEAPSVKDFALRLFQACYFMTIAPDCPESIRLNDEALVFLKRFKDSRKYLDAFEKCSAIASDTLGIESDLAKRKVEMLGDVDFFKQIDAHILNELASRIRKRTITATDCANIVRSRRQTFWYKRLEHAYLAMDFASQFLHTLNGTKIAVDSLLDGFNCYTKQYYLLDQLYRKFIYHAMAAEQNDLLADLLTMIENFYSNNYLLKLSNLWQEKLDELASWNIHEISKQEKFFSNNIQNILDKDKKIFVIVSDALRYEVAEELCGRIIAENRYEATLESAYSVLPSFTALGMAALLPHKELTVKSAGKTIAVWADGMNTQGTIARAKVLAATCPRSTVVTAEELLSMPKESGRALFRDNDVAYVYHNAIDKQGDDKMTESQTCGAAETAIEEIIIMVKRLVGYNATNIIVTSDHGFIYQNEDLSNDEFLGDEPSGSVLLKVNRRFVIGQGLAPIEGLKKYSLDALGLYGDCEIQIPKSINRLRVQGAGSRYVHGGSSLQEIVIPILKIRKKRGECDTSLVDVDITSGMTVITSGQLAVKCYQQQPVGGKTLPRKLLIGLYSQTGELISNEHELLFDLSSISPRERELTCGLVLTHDAEKYNGQEVVLKLREKESGTTYYKDYQIRKYQLRRQLMDMDF